MARTYVTLFVTLVGITAGILLLTVLYLGVMYGWKNTLEALPPRDMKELREMEDLIAAMFVAPAVGVMASLIDRVLRATFGALRWWR
jgi:hypothetical protein